MSRAFPPDYRLLLASQSPRRRELLDVLGVPYQVVRSLADEHERGADPGSLAERNALAKALGAVLPRELVTGPFVLGVDTIVVVGGAILGKPVGAAQARDMLESLAGREHEVVSGVALLRLGGDGGERARVVGHAVTVVRMSPGSDRDRTAYLDSGEWEGKAGAYAIQGLGALLVDRIEGEYSNVVGLPLGLLARLSRELGFDLLSAAWVEPRRSGMRPSEVAGTAARPVEIGAEEDSDRAARDTKRASARGTGIIPGSGATRQEE